MPAIEAARIIVHVDSSIVVHGSRRLAPSWGRSRSPGLASGYRIAHCRGSCHSLTTAPFSIAVTTANPDVFSHIPATVFNRRDVVHLR